MPSVDLRAARRAGAMVFKWPAMFSFKTTEHEPNMPKLRGTVIMDLVYPFHE